MVAVKEVYNLWQAVNELLKLASFNKQISKQDVMALVRPRLSENVFELSDEVLRKNEAAAQKGLEHLLAGEQTDEKSAVIKIIGLLANTREILMSSKDRNCFQTYWHWTSR